jgi:hypothetical protein
MVSVLVPPSISSAVSKLTTKVVILRWSRSEPTTTGSWKAPT